MPGLIAVALACLLLLAACAGPAARSVAAAAPRTNAPGGSGPSPTPTAHAGSAAATATASVTATAAAATTTATANAGAPPVLSATGPHVPTPRNVRAIYLTGWTAGAPARVAALIAYVRRNHLNAMVIDIKDNDGRLSFALPGTTAEAMGANRSKIPHPKRLLRELHADGIYVIGRIVTFADPFLARKRPQWAIHQDGRVWLDRHGNPWIDPKNAAVWNYNIQIGVAAAELGFDEIQYDYIRLPATRLAGYNIHNTAAEREAPIDAFLRRARQQIGAAAHVPVSGDVFAIDAVAVDPPDEFIGQNYTRIAHVLDFISPMVYPSLYAPGEFGFPNPNARPYDTVWETIASAEARTPDLPRSRLRPWIQDYTLGRPAYGPAQVDAELQALAASDIHAFMLWNAANVYTNGVDFGLIDSTPAAVPAAPWLQATFGLIASGAAVYLPASLPAAPAGRAYTLTANSGSTGYAVGLWATAQALPTNDPRVNGGELLLAVSGAPNPAELAPLPAMAVATRLGTGTFGPAPATGAAASVAAGSGVTAGAGTTSASSQGPASETSPGGAATRGPAATATRRVDLGAGVWATLAPAGHGLTLRWQAHGEAFRIWAATAAAAVAAARSMRHVSLLEGR